MELIDITPDVVEFGGGDNPDRRPSRRRTAILTISALAIIAASAALAVRAHTINTAPAPQPSTTGDAAPTRPLVANANYTEAIDGQNFLIAFQVSNAAGTELNIQFGNPPQVPGFDHLTAAALNISLWAMMNDAHATLPSDSVVGLASNETAIIAIAGHVTCPTSGSSDQTLSLAAGEHLTAVQPPLIDGKTWNQHIAAQVCGKQQ